MLRMDAGRKFQAYGPAIRKRQFSKFGENGRDRVCESISRRIMHVDK